MEIRSYFTMIYIFDKQVLEGPNSSIPDFLPWFKLKNLLYIEEPNH